VATLRLAHCGGLAAYLYRISLYGHALFQLRRAWRALLTRTPLVCAPAVATLPLKEKFLGARRHLPAGMRPVPL